MTFAPAPILETDRLILRAPAAEDLEPWVEFAGDAETMRFLGGAQARSVAWRGLCTVLGAWSIRGFGMFSVIEKSSGRWIGRLGPWQPEDWPGTEVGWGLARESWGKGYATEGAVAAMDFAFDKLGWTEAIHTIEPGNVASQAVAKRLGATLWGPSKMPPPYEHEVVETWGQTREQWRARKR
jgi:RimJ/RimL family protein N-acetyltransferase